MKFSRTRSDIPVVLPEGVPVVLIISLISIRVHVAKFMFASSDRNMFLPARQKTVL